ncbi:MAG: hypothetical protein GY820_01885, partial [Gammaproteobacteria bacterium]|nr:hypothetical protein [Gammaproteobacteria bacterium]
MANFRSVRNKLHELNSELCANPHRIYAISETWLSLSDNDSIFSDSHTSFRCDRQGKLGGGVMFLVPKTISAHEISSVSNDSFEAISIQITTTSNSLVMILVYRCPGEDYNFAKSFTSYFESLNLNSPFLLLGDFNMAEKIDWASLTTTSTVSTSAYRGFFEFCVANGLEQHVLFPTHSSGNTLDLVFSSVSGLLSGVFSLNPLLPSIDHSPILVCLTSSCNTNPDTVLVHCFRNVDFDGFSNALLSIPWRDMFNTCTTADQMYTIFSDIFNQLIEAFVPKRKIIPGRKSWPPSVMSLQRSQRILYNKFRRHPTATNKDKYQDAQKAYRLEIRRYIHQREGALLSHPNDRAFWAYVNSKLKVRPVIPSLQSNGPLDRPITDDYQKAEAFNDQFRSVFTTDDGIIPPTPTVPESVPMLCNFRVSEGDVYEQLRNLPNKASYGPDGIPQVLLKKFALYLVEPLTIIFNVSLGTGKLPKIWKLANVTPIHKKGPKISVQNYRPISLTCATGKVLERLVRAQLIKHLMQHNLISPQQHGFLARKSTVTQLLSCITDWSNELDKGCAVDVAYLDIAKAFDTVSHAKLLEILKCYGLRGSFLEWINNFLTNRYQRVRVGNSFSSHCKVESGVPQGSVLGPLLFLLYINDLPNIVKHSNIYIYADDTKISFAFKKNIRPTGLQTDLINVIHWASQLQLAVALTKCAVLHLGTTNPCSSYLIDNQNLQPVNHIRDLGVIIDNELHFSKQCADIASRA